MGKQNFDAAVKVFDINVSAFPNSGNAYDSRAEAYFYKKDYGAATRDFKRSLELDPKNENAREMLKKIESITEKQ